MWVTGGFSNSAAACWLLVFVQFSNKCSQRKNTFNSCGLSLCSNLALRLWFTIVFSRSGTRNHKRVFLQVAGVSVLPIISWKKQFNILLIYLLNIIYLEIAEHMVVWSWTRSFQIPFERFFSGMSVNSDSSSMCQNGQQAVTAGCLCCQGAFYLGSFGFLKQSLEQPERRVKDEAINGFAGGSMATCWEFGVSINVHPTPIVGEQLEFAACYVLRAFLDSSLTFHPGTKRRHFACEAVLATLSAKSCRHTWNQVSWWYQQHSSNTAERLPWSFGCWAAPFPCSYCGIGKQVITNTSVWITSCFQKLTWLGRLELVLLASGSQDNPGRKFFPSEASRKTGCAVSARRAATAALLQSLAGNLLCYVRFGSRSESLGLSSSCDLCWWGALWEDFFIHCIRRFWMTVCQFWLMCVQGNTWDEAWTKSLWGLGWTILAGWPCLTPDAVAARAASLQSCSWSCSSLDKQ